MLAATKTREKRPAMTAAEARMFETFSVTNSTIVEESRDCDCEAYEDIFTFRRWIALGFSVRKGEHGTKIGVVRKRTIEDEETEEAREIRLRGSAVVFCRCQVEPIKTKRGK